MKQEYLRIVCVLLGRGYADFTQIDLFLIFVPPHEVLKYSDEWLVVLRTSYYFSFFVLFCTPPPTGNLDCETTIDQN